MSKKEIQRRVGQLYAQGIQYGYAENEMIELLEKTFGVAIDYKKKEWELSRKMVKS